MWAYNSYKVSRWYTFATFMSKVQLVFLLLFCCIGKSLLPVCVYKWKVWGRAFVVMYIVYRTGWYNHAYNEYFFPDLKMAQGTLENISKTRNMAMAHLSTQMDLDMKVQNRAKSVELMLLIQQIHFF